jgi:hypothetical protein
MKELIKNSEIKSKFADKLLTHNVFLAEKQDYTNKEGEKRVHLVFAQGVKNNLEVFGYNLKGNIRRFVAWSVPLEFANKFTVGETYSQFHLRLQQVACNPASPASFMLNQNNELREPLLVNDTYRKDEKGNPIYQNIVWIDKRVDANVEDTRITTYQPMSKTEFETYKANIGKKVTVTEGQKAELVS